MSTLAFPSTAERTRDSVHRWALSMPASRYLITAVPSVQEAGDVAHRRFFSLGELDDAIPWLRWLNTKGFHVVGRPWSTRHVLVDDLSHDALDDFRRSFRVAAVVESSSGSFQAWLTVSDDEIGPALADAVAKKLATRFGGDRFAARASQCGRVPGFTNRKAKHFQVGRGFPYALLRHAGPAASGTLAELLDGVRAEMGPGLPRPDGPPAMPSCVAPDDAGPAGDHAYRQGLAALVASLPGGLPIDRSRADFAIARRMLGRGCSVAEAVSAIRHGAKAMEKSPAHAEAYARMTVEAAERSGPERPWRGR